MAGFYVTALDLTARDNRNPNRLLGLATLYSIMLIIPTLVLLMLDQRLLQDEALWLKPLKFQVSLGLLTATLIWAIARFGPNQGRSNWVIWPAGAVAITAIYENSFLMIQAARGVPSHFNQETLFDAVGHALMQGGASVLVLGAAMIGAVILVATLWRNGIQNPLALATGLGLVTGGILGGYTGSFIGMNGGPFIGAYNPADPAWPIMGWSGTIGDLRVSHFVGMHLMQGVPLVAALLPKQLSYVSQTAIIGGVTVIGCALTIWTLTTAQAGLPLLPL